MKDDEGRQPDALEKGLRIGCGGLFGAVLGLYALTRMADLTSPQGWTVVGCAVVLCAAGALYGGDSFWMGLARARRRRW